MEDYRLEQTGQEVQDILNGAAKNSDLVAETERAEGAEGTLQDNIDAEALARQDADGLLQQGITDEELRAKSAEEQAEAKIVAIEGKIPSGASSENKLATEEYVDDSVATNTATYRGNYNLVSDLHLGVDATHEQIAFMLSGTITTADNNDYCFVQVPTSAETPTEIRVIERYKFNGEVWGFEYALNNSGYTAAQWAAINSGITSALVTKLGALPTAADLAAALLGKQDVLTFDSAPTQGSNNPAKSGGIWQMIDDEKGARINRDAELQAAIEAILVLIPSAATALNQLADKAFVNSSVATETATFRGTYNLVSDLHLSLDATHDQIAAALGNAISTADNNDYAFVQIPTSVDTPTEIRITERYKFNGTAWQYEYDLNNSGFTAAQWAAINSGITALLVSKLSELPTATELATALAGKQAVLTFDNAPTQSSDNPVKSGGVYTAIKNETDARELSEQGLQQGISTNAGDIGDIKDVIPSGATALNQLVDNDSMVAYVTTLISGISATFNVTSADGHITLHITQVDGEITSVTITTSDIASAAALNLKASQADLEALTSVVNTKASQSDLTTLAGRVSVNETDISNLQAAYAGLTQSDIIVGALPASGVANTIYRVPGTSSYSDYMWNGSTWVLMATYNNAIDDVPTAGSNNLVKSGGVFDSFIDILGLNGINRIVTESYREKGLLVTTWNNESHRWNWASYSSFAYVEITNILAYRNKILKSYIQGYPSGDYTAVGGSKNSALSFRVTTSDMIEGYSLNGISFNGGVLLIDVNELLSHYDVQTLTLTLQRNNAIFYESIGKSEILSTLDRHDTYFSDIAVETEKSVEDERNENLYVWGWNSTNGRFDWVGCTGFSYVTIADVRKLKGFILYAALPSLYTTGQLIGGYNGNEYVFNLANEQFSDGTTINGVTLADGVLEINVDELLYYYPSTVSIAMTLKNGELLKRKAIELRKTKTEGLTLALYGDSVFDNLPWSEVMKDKLNLSKVYDRSCGGSGYVHGFITEVAYYTDSRKDTDEFIMYGYKNMQGEYVLIGGGTFDPNNLPSGVSLMSAYQPSQDRVNTIPVNTDIVVIGGGVNDFQIGAPLLHNYTDYSDLPSTFDDSYFDDAVLDTILKIQTRCPNALILVCGIAPYHGSAEAAVSCWREAYRGRAKAYDDTMQFCANILGKPYMSLINNLGVNPLNIFRYTDGVHPNSILGYERYAQTIGSFITSKLLG